MLKKIFTEHIWHNLKKSKPLVYNITNYVTVNDCANILLAVGGSPIMSDAVEEAEDLVKICDGLNINIGTLNNNSIECMLTAGKKANELDKFIIFDAVGVGASEFRKNTAKLLMENIKFDVIKGNLSEIMVLFDRSNKTRGVDVNKNDEIDKQKLDDIVKFALNVANKLNSIIVITGKIDIIADKKNAYCIFNGNEMMSKVTGTGCQLSSLIAAVACVNKNFLLEAVASAVCIMGISGEIAYKKLKFDSGNASYRNYIIDAVYNFDVRDFEEFANYKFY